MIRHFIIALLLFESILPSFGQDHIFSSFDVNVKEVAATAIEMSFVEPQKKQLQLATSYPAQLNPLEVHASRLSTLSALKIEERIFYPDTVKTIFPEWKEAFVPVFKDKARYNLKYLDILQGLNSSYVVDVKRGPEGFLWFATLGGGIGRYDGSRIQHFSKESGLKSERVYDLNFDARGNLWFATKGGGFGMFDGDHFYNYMQGEDASRDMIYGMSILSDGKIAFLTADGILGILNEDSLMAYDLTLALDFDEGHKVHQDDNGSLWVTTNSGFLNITNGIVTSYVFDINPSSYWEIGSSKDGLWFCGSIRAVFYDGSGFYQLSSGGFPPEPFFMGYGEDSEGNSWFGTYGNGIYRFNGNTLTRYQEDDGLSIDYVWAFEEDEAGNLWMGTDGGGMAVLQNTPISFLTEESGLSNPYIMSIDGDADGDLWLATYGGGVNRLSGGDIDVWDQIGNLKIDFVYSIRSNKSGSVWIGTDSDGLINLDLSGKKIKRYTRESGLADNTIRSLYIDSNGLLWIGTESKGLINFDGNTFRSFLGNSELSAGYISCIAEDSEGDIWVGTDGGGVFEVSDDEVKQYSLITGFFSDNIVSLHVDRKDGVWVGSQGSGVARIVSDSNFVVFSETEGLANNTVLSIAEDKKGRVWLGTGRGISVINNPGFTPSRPYYPNQEQARIEIIDEYDGLKSVDFFSNSIFIDQEQRLLLGSGKNLTSINLEEFSEVRQGRPPRVLLTEIRINRTTVQFRHENKGFSFEDRRSFHNYPLGLTLEPQISELDFQYSAINWQDPSNVYFSYRIGGEGVEWSTPSQNSRLNFKNLADGAYRLEMRASSDLRSWSDPFVFEFTVLPVWYNTWWAYLLYVIITLAMLFILIRYRTRQLEKRKSELEREVFNATKKVNQTNGQLVKLNKELLEQRNELESVVVNLKNTQSKLVESEKMASLGVLSAGMAHEINNPLNFIKGGVYSIRKLANDNGNDSIRPFLEAIEEGVNRATTIVRSLNHFSRQGTSMTEKCDIHMILENCLIMMHNEAKYRINVVKNFTADHFVIRGNEGQLHQVFLNILTNAEQAIADKGTISIMTKVQEDNEFLMEISDDGEGISKENLARIKDPFFTTKEPGKGTGLGLSISYSIIENHKGKINFDSEAGKGTKVSIILPVEKYTS